MSQQQHQNFRKLQLTYKKWQQLQARGQLKMRMKVDKQNKEYFDFDFSKYQYYYNYPNDHFAFLPPLRQKELFEQLLGKVLHNEKMLFDNMDGKNDNQRIESDNLDDNQHKFMYRDQQYLDFSKEYSNKLFNLLKPYQLQQFLHDYKQRLRQKITTLRIKKSLLNPSKVKQHFKDTQNKSHAQATVQLLETEIRTYLSKLNKVIEQDLQFGQDILQRFQEKKCHLKTSDRDQMHFTSLEKTDLIIYQRLIKTDKKFLYPLKCLQYQVALTLKMKYPQIQQKAYIKLLQKIKHVQQQEKIDYDMRRQTIMRNLTENQPYFLQQFSNLSSIDQFLKNLTYTHKLSAIKSRGYLNIDIHYKDVTYIPHNQYELSLLVQKVCANHFQPQLLKKLTGQQSKETYSEEHLCYKLIKLGSTMFRIAQETYDLTLKCLEREILSKKVLMQRQLETVFAKDVGKLLKLEQHQAIILVDSTFQHGYKISSLEQKVTSLLPQRQLIYQRYFDTFEFQDPFLNSLAALLFTRKQKNLHQVIDEYTSTLRKKQVFQLKTKHIMLFYDNIHSDPKNHLINVMNKKLSFTQQTNSNPNFTKFLLILQQYSQQPSQRLSFQLLNSVYFLRVVSTLVLKNKLLNIMNGQVNIMLKVKNKLNFLKHKGNLRFQLSKQFITRYTETNEKKQDPFDFLRDIQTVDQKVSYELHCDKLFIDLQGDSVCVKRTSPQSNLFIYINIDPLYQGKKIIYSIAVQETQQAIQRLVRLGSLMIERRENFLFGQELSLVVDRVELLYELVNNEVKYQFAKMRLLSEYVDVFRSAVTPEGIESVCMKIYLLKKEQFSMSLNQNTFSEEYQHATTNLQLKLSLLKQLKEVVTNTEKKQLHQVKNGNIRRNLSHNSPQISSIYYQQSAKVGEQIQQQDQFSSQQQLLGNNSSNTHNLIIDSDSKSQVLAHSVILQTSQFSSTHRSYKHSDYHVKKTFREILNVNETPKIKNSMEKKQQLLNRKKKRVFNDTILGRLLDYTFQSQTKTGRTKITVHSQYLHLAQSIMSFVEKRLQQDQKYKQRSIQNIALQQIITQLTNYQSRDIHMQQTLSEQLLPFTLHQCSKLLSKLVEKVKTQPNLIQHLVCFDASVIENLINNSTGKQINTYRGLYLGLNHIQMEQVMYQSQLTSYRQQRLRHYLQTAIHTYTSFKLPTQHSLLLHTNILQTHINPQYKLYTQTQQRNQPHLTVIGQYNTYIKLLFLGDSLLMDYYEKLLCNLMEDHIGGFEMLCTQLQLMYKGGCWIGNGQKSGVNQFARIQNKVWIGKKLDSIIENKRNLVTKETIAEFLELLLKIITQTITKTYKQKKPTQPSNASQASHQFASYLNSIFLLNSKIITINSRMHHKLSTHEAIVTLQSYLKILPYLNQKIILNKEESKIVNEVFSQEMVSRGQKINYEEDNEECRKDDNVVSVSQVRLKSSLLLGILQSIANKPQFILKVSQVYAKVTKRQFFEFKSKREKQNNKRSNTHYLQKQFGIINSSQSPKMYFQKLLDAIPSLQFQEHHRLSSLVKLIETRLLIFGLELTPQQLTHFRILLFERTENFTIFWKDETSNYIKSKEFVKLRNFRLDGGQLLQSYKQEYVTFGNLKNKYKSMIDKMVQLDLEQELEDSIYLLVNCMYFVGMEGKLRNDSVNDSGGSLMRTVNQQNFSFLYTFGDDLHTPDSLRQFFSSILKQQISLKLMIKNFNFQSFGKTLWQEQIKSSQLNEFRQFDERSKFLRYHINALKRKQEKEVSLQILHFRLQKFILNNVLRSVQISEEMHKMQLQIFSKSFREKVNENVIILTPTYRRILDLGAKSIDARSKLDPLKDQALQSVYFIKYYQKILSKKLFSLSQSILCSELQLRKCLGDSFQQRQLNKDSKVIAQSLNKVLAPKIMLNPFLNSPLLLDNYFFAGSLKLSYIDQFLNRMKNRAIMVELAEGGFGFLLKVSQLDQCVNSLCKGIISYSEKEFNDRLRTYFQYTDQLRGKLTKVKKENDHLKNINKLHSFYDQKELKSMIYQKLHSYIECITEKEKTYQTLFSMFKNLQHTLMQQCGEKYQNRIFQLEQENKVLKQTFRDFQEQLKKSALSSVTESRDKLYGEFKQKIENVLGKEFMPAHEQIAKSTFCETEAYESDILLKKLKSHSIVTKLKASITNQQYQKRIQELERRLEEKENLLREIKQEREKNLNLMTEVTFLSGKAIEVEALEKQSKVDLQEKMMEKFKLIKINESLHGKLKRLEDSGKEFRSITQLQDTKKSQRKLQEHLKTQPDEKKHHQSVFLTRQSQLKTNTEFYRQTMSQSKKPFETPIKSRIRKRSVLVKPSTQQQPNISLQTQYHLNRSQNIDDSKLWREKWEKCESKYQKLMNKVNMIGQNFKITKNGKKIGEKIIMLMDEINCEPPVKKLQLSQII